MKAEVLSIIFMMTRSSHAWTTARTDRRDWVENVASTIIASSVGAVLPLPANAVYNDPKTGTMLPEEGEIATAIPTDWSGEESPLAGDDKSLLSRLDKNPDSLFYTDPRFVEHIDENAVKLMTNFVTNRAVKNGDSVLDLCSSWTSHLGEGKVQVKRMAGLGMNEKELSSNPSLTEFTVRDLNDSPKLPYDDASFSVVLCQLSIDYLTRPLEVLKEVGRVLQPGGRVYVLFSNRLFIQKAVALWTGADDIDHAYTVGGYLHFSDGGFEDIAAEDLSTRKGKRIVGDPLYVVSGVKKA
mmetsp:Transcript_33083/g.54634  ORF Transcript_33083/g.54634 Transcript_33083/m.54634 type:complete len:297 (-) Transcript_33083:111-1001(-)|eukprot:CAMPEP_0119011446 /NCGR_PEP_ID=MMETSP1176-20130426/5686_1 /TAXON_ID=265551 /ORGANISM="Synedropsis recta cf, Strain CCMP1620" /LENGTH=296 /DNA_ID=CAMNT_0006964279 /DNA_START=10 /DNA_END=900 /DNA_ORIENTATION=-